ncbi:MAG TPA: cytochrome c [Vicinamibacterales bacterium]|nr:cytochrome c [Vicinamibacterales bacterium]
MLRFTVRVLTAVLACTVAVILVQPASLTVGAQDDIVSHFKYGSIGTEGRVGIPYPIFRVLPIVFADKLPNRPGQGYERLGFVYEPNAPQGRPIGTSYKEDRVPLVGLNCATCHTGTVRDSPSSPRRIIAGMPAHQMDLQGFANFLTAAARDPRFEAGTLIAAIRQADPDFSWFNSLVYRFFVIKRTRDGILERAEENSWFADRPPQGPGRVDTFNPYKKMFGFDMKADLSVGTADLPPLFRQRVRDGIWLHWDGNNNEVEERNKSAAIGAGATEDSIDLASLDRIAAWTLDLSPPAMPVERIDRALAEKGAPIYRAVCARCHEFGGSAVGMVTPLAEIGTDPERVRSFTAALADRMNTLGTGKPWKFSHFRKTDGYANMPLDGVWLRAPYLHNGSVPTLRALLFPEERPAIFYRGYDVYDWQKVGFVSEGPDAEQNGVRFDTSLRGNSNTGHTYGSELSAGDRQALIEYLKTL